MIERHGEEEGIKKWDIYRKRQAYTNSFEYKNKKFNMSEEDFETYNKSRSCTKELFIERHGEERGLDKWNVYCKRQGYTNTKDHLGDRYEEVNKKKAHNFDNYLIRFADEETAKEELENYWNKQSESLGSYSPISQELFWNLYNKLDSELKRSCHFGELNGEYCLYDKVTKSCLLYDFVCSAKKLVIEYQGDHFHGNPDTYAPSDYLKGFGVTNLMACEKWKFDLEKKKIIEDQRGYKMIYIWDSEYKADKDGTLDKLLKEFNNAN